MTGIDLGGPIDDERDNHARDRAEDQPGCARVAAVEATLTLLLRRCVLDADDREDHQ